MTSIIGIDIGGANIKYVRRGRGSETNDIVARSRYFPMWRQSGSLCDALAKDIQTLGRSDALAVTMTGELADCFVDREVGVAHIVDHSLRAAALSGINETKFYGVDGQFHAGSDATKRTDIIAASNWHALASFVGQNTAADALLVDIGSTTTDIIPITAGRVATDAQTDFDRLQEGSLVYVGCRRTPVCALVDQLTFRGQHCAVMNEFFATIDDARLVLGTIPDLPDDCDTADGKPRTSAFAANRLARMIGLDRRTASADDTWAIAEQVIKAARSRIHTAIQGIARRPEQTWVLSGHGPDLLDLPSEHNRVRLSDIYGEAISRSAPAYAVANLLSAQLSNSAN